MNNDSLLNYEAIMRLKDSHKEQAIIESAIYVFAHDGFFKSKMHKIADRAGVAAGTVYLYFGGKDALLLKIFESVWERLFRLIERIQHQEQDHFPDKIDSMIDVIFDFFTANSSLARVFANEQNRIGKPSRIFTIYHEKTMNLVEELAAEGITKGYFNYPLSPQIFSAFVFGGLRFLLNQWAVEPRKYPLESIRHNVKNILLQRNSPELYDNDSQKNRSGS
jgi:TetR/AcrR family transcriptional regulator, fatty acid metabolism regulator protein